MFTTNQPQTTILAVTVPLLSALVLAGCSTTTADQSASSGTTPTSAASAPSASTPGSSTSASQSDAALLTAAKTALAAVSGGKVISIEQEAAGSSWEILLATSDGDEHEVHTGADGTSITAGPTKKSSDAEDLTENRAFLAAYGIDYAEAASTMTTTVSGTVTELSLDDHLGKTVWEGDIVDSSGTNHSIRLNSTTGSVVTNAIDTDD